MVSQGVRGGDQRQPVAPADVDRRPGRELLGQLADVIDVELAETTIEITESTAMADPDRTRAAA